MAKERNESVFDLLGGENVIAAVINVFYKKVINDDKLNHFFSKMNVDKIKQHQTVFFSYLLGSIDGHNKAERYNLQKIHSYLNIKEEHFLAVANHLVDTLKQFNVPKNIIDAIAVIVINMWKFPKTQKILMDSANASMSISKSATTKNSINVCMDDFIITRIEIDIDGD